VIDRTARVLDRVRDTPPGFVRTYGDVSPGAPRFAGAVLHACDDEDVPWHRIVRAGVNGQVGFGHYFWDAERARFTRHGIGVLTLRGARIADLTTFLEPRLFGHLGLPLERA